MDGAANIHSKMPVEKVGGDFRERGRFTKARVEHQGIKATMRVSHRRHHALQILR